MLSSEKEKDVALCCYAMVCGMFATLSNKYNQGPSFTWDTFAEGMGIFCKDNILQNLKVRKPDMQDTLILAQSIGTRIADSMVKQLKGVK